MVDLELDGTISFAIDAPGARRVELVGAFHGWDEQRLAMRRTAGGMWRLRLDPGPGESLFRYFIDRRRWIVDETAHGTVMTADGIRKSRVWRPPIALDPDALAA